jgi:predicted ArsR family transcriptional regulator
VADQPFLTKRQALALRMMSESQFTTGLPPTLAELGARMQIARTTVLDHVKALVEKGQIEAGPRGAQRRYRVKRHVLRRYAGSDALCLLAAWRAAPQEDREQFANFVLHWWTTQKEKCSD